MLGPACASSSSLMTADRVLTCGGQTVPNMRSVRIRADWHRRWDRQALSLCKPQSAGTRLPIAGALVYAPQPLGLNTRQRVEGQWRLCICCRRNDKVDTFAADFRLACDGGTAIVGGVRLNSSVPATDPGFDIDSPPPPPPVDTTAPIAAANLIQTGRLKGQSSSFYVSAVCTDESPGVELISAEINGNAVSPGDKVNFTISNRERVLSRMGKLTIQAASITLTVICVDAAGNPTADTVQPSYDG